MLATRRECLKLLAPAALTLAARHAVSAPLPTPATHVYKVVNDCEVKLDIYATGNSAKRPVVIWIHGGALITGTRTGLPSFLHGLAQDPQYAVVSIDYRLAPETKLPAIIEDLQDAHRWVRSRGPRLFGADPDRIVVTGGSAGGYLTLMSGFCLKPVPSALVSYYGYGDIVGDWYSKPDPFYSQQPAVPKDEAYKAVGGPPLSTAPPGNTRGRFYLYCRQHGIWPREVAGHDPETENAWFDPYSPIRNVTKNYPPTLLIHGTKDTDVPYEQSKLMADTLSEVGVEHELLTVPGAGHGLTGIDPDERKRIDEHAVTFIKNHLK